MLKSVVTFVTLCMTAMPGSQAQEGVAPQQPDTSAPYALSVQSRLVVEDVLVVDKQDRPVTGLPLSAFHIYDNGKPQKLRDFQEATAINRSTSEDRGFGQENAGGSFSNAGLFHNQDSVVVLLIDPTTMHLEEQMYLRMQALKFIQEAPQNTGMAIFRVNDASVPVLLQPLTRNKADLEAAISAAVPTLIRSSRTFGSAIVELQNISDYLRAVPGRKSVLWLAGAFPLYQEPDYGGLCDYGSGSVCGSRPVVAHLSAEEDAYRSLEAARVAVYPIDVRGVQMGGLTSMSGKVGAKPTSETERVTGQYDEMDRLADATGGRAFYSNNHVSSILNQALQLTNDGYALAYQPEKETADGGWHRVTVRVDGPYTVHYRTGYYATPNARPRPVEPRRQLSQDGTVAPPGTRPASAVKNAFAESSTGNQPLIFSAHVIAEAGSRTKEVKIRYVIPMDQLSSSAEDSGHAHFRITALAYDVNGDVLSHASEIIDTHFSKEQSQLAQRIGAPADQKLEVTRGASYLLLAVEDLNTENVGVVQLPLKQATDKNSTGTSSDQERAR